MIRKLLVALGIGTLLAACASTPPTIPPVASVDLPRFMGDWYVIAQIPTYIERKAFDSVESYRLDEDGKIRTTFRYRNGSADAPLKTMEPVGRVVPGTNNAVWEMQFVWPIQAEYVIVDLAPDYSLGQALTFLDQTAAKVLKPGTTTDLNGISREFRSSQGALMVVFVLALLFIFLVLAAQFESFIDPLVIMLSVPLSMAGALLALKWSGGTLNVFSQIGLITLVGLITKHGILMVEFANQLREQGMEMVQAIKQSASQRLRPILMTTGAMVLGAIPLALASGAGAESRRQIGWVIVGGMSLGTLLTVFVVPTMYTLLARKHAPGAIKTVVVDHIHDAAGQGDPAHPL